MTATGIVERLTTWLRGEGVSMDAERIANALMNWLPPELERAGMVAVPREELIAIHSALDDATGDTDVAHIEDEAELRSEEPVQWAAMKLAKLIWKDDEHGT
jgi:hypothetical protein